jgi:hypothetical protein
MPGFSLVRANFAHRPHPLMSRMHKPDPKLLPDQQDKRSVIALADGDVDTWLALFVAFSRGIQGKTGEQTGERFSM